MERQVFNSLRIKKDAIEAGKALIFFQFLMCQMRATEVIKDIFYQKSFSTKSSEKPFISCAEYLLLSITFVTKDSCSLAAMFLELYFYSPHINRSCSNNHFLILKSSVVRNITLMQWRRRLEKK